MTDDERKKFARLFYFASHVASLGEATFHLAKVNDSFESYWKFCHCDVCHEFIDADDLTRPIEVDNGVSRHISCRRCAEGSAPVS